MKLRYKLEFLEIDNDIVGITVDDFSPDSNFVLQVNYCARDILEALQEETTEEEILKKLVNKYTSSTEEEISVLLHDYIGELKAKNLLYS